MQICISILLAAVWFLAAPAGPRAEVVGHFQKVEGPVDLLKQGKPPPLTPKVQDALEPGDVIRTKSQGRARVKFVDDSVLTIAPGTRVAVETYMFDAGQGVRKAVLQVFRGMVEAAVVRIFKTQEPDFIMKTHTAVLGVRGTKWYALLLPHATDVYNESGKLCVRNIFSEIVGEVCLKDMEFTRVMLNLAPTTPMPFQQNDLAPLQKLLTSGAANGGNNFQPPGSMGGPLPFAFLDQLDLFSLRNTVSDFRNSLNQPVLGRDFLENRDRYFDRPERPHILHRPSPGPGPGPWYTTPGKAGK